MARSSNGLTEIIGEIECLPQGSPLAEPPSAHYGHVTLSPHPLVGLAYQMSSIQCQGPELGDMGQPRLLEHVLETGTGDRMFGALFLILSCQNSGLYPLRLQWTELFSLPPCSPRRLGTSSPVGLPLSPLPNTGVLQRSLVFHFCLLKTL